VNVLSLGDLVVTGGQTIAAVIAIPGIFGNKNVQASTVLDSDDVSQRLREGLNEVSDADARSGAYARRYPGVDEITLGQAELARRMEEALSGSEKK